MAAPANHHPFDGKIVTLRSKYGDRYLYESEETSGYKEKGISSCHASTNKNALSWGNKKAKWKMINKGDYWLIKSEFRGAYLYDSEKYTGSGTWKGAKYSYVSTHNCGPTWGKYASKCQWVLEKHGGHYNLKSKFRNSYLYASGRAASYKTSFYACGNPYADEWDEGKADWIISVV